MITLTADEDEAEALEDDDLELLEENTGASFRNQKLSRLTRNRGSPPAKSSKRKTILESSDDDLDNDDLDIPQVQDIQRIWDDDRTGDPQDEEDLDDMDNFIEYDDDDEEGAGMMDEEEREEKRKEKRRVEKERRKAMGVRPELAGIDAK